MASRKSSILKPRKTREPLQDLNQLLPNNDEEETTTTTGLGKRRVSFASMNKVKEFESAAECLTLLNTPAYDERFSISSDSCQSSVLGVTHAESLKIVSKENSIHDDIAVEEEIELTETVGGKILESTIKSRADSSMEFTTPYSAITKQPDSILQYDLTNQNRSDFDTSCMETTDVITNNLFSETLCSQLCPDSKYEEREAISECQDMEISPYRELLPLSRKSIFHPDQNIPTRKSIFDLPPSQLPKLEDLVGKEKSFCSKEITNDENVSMDVSIPVGEGIEEDVPLVPPTAMNFENVDNKPRKSIFSQSFNASNMERPFRMVWNTDSEKNDTQPACPISGGKTAPITLHNSSLPIFSQTPRYESASHNSSMQPLSNRTEYHNSSMQLTSQPIAPINEGSVFNQASQYEAVSHNSSMQPLNNRTEYHNSSMQLLSQPIEPNNEGPVFSQASQYEPASLNSSMQTLNNRTDHRNSSIQLMTQPIDRTEYHNSSMQLVSQPIESNNDEELIERDDSRMRSMSQKTNKTNCNNSNMQLASQETNAITESRIDKTRFNCSDMQLTSEETNAVVEPPNDNRTRFDNTNMQIASQETHTIVESRIDKTPCSNSNLQLVTEETNKSRIDNKTDFNRSDMLLEETNAITEPQVYDKTRLNNLTEEECGISPLTEFDGDKTKTSQIDDAKEKTHLDVSMMPLTSRVSDDGFTIGEGTEESSVKDTKSDQKEGNNEDELVVLEKLETSHERGDVNDVKNEAQKSYSDNNSSSTNSDSNSPLRVGVNFSIFQKNKETRVEFSSTIDSNKKKRSNSISNVQVNIINNRAKKENCNVQKLRFSMPATKSNHEQTKPRVYASYVDVKVPRETGDLSNQCARDVEDLESFKLMSPVQESLSLVADDKKESSPEENRERTSTKKRLSSEMLMGENEEDFTTSKRRSISTTRTCEMMKEVTVNHEIVSNENVINQVENVDLRQVCKSTQVTQRRESVVFEDQLSSSVISVEKVIVETSSKLQTLTCTTNKSSFVETDLDKTKTPSALSPTESRNFVEELPANDELDPSKALQNTSQTDEESVDKLAVEVPSIENKSSDQKSPLISNSRESEGALSNASRHENCDPETAVECTSINEKTYERKSLTVDDVSSDNEPPMKDCSPELASDNDTNRWSMQTHHTPCRKRSVKSLGGQSVFEDDSIIVQVGNSFSNRSYDLGTANVSAPDLRDYCDLKERNGTKVKEIENIPSVNVSKVSFVSDWLQNKTRENGPAEKINNGLENHSSSGTVNNKILSFEKSTSVSETSSKELVSVENAELEDRLKNLNDEFSEPEKIDSSPAVEIEPVAVTESAPSDVNVIQNTVAATHLAADDQISPCALNPLSVDVSAHIVLDNELTENKSNSINVEGNTPTKLAEDDHIVSHVPNSATASPVAAGTNELVPDSGNAATLDQSKANYEMEIVCQTEDTNALPVCAHLSNSLLVNANTGFEAQLSVSNREELSRTISHENVEIIDLIQPTLETVNAVDDFEPFVENEEPNLEENAYSEVDCVDHDDEIDRLELMHTSAHNIELDETNRSVNNTEMSLHEISACEPLNDKGAILNLKEETLEKIREEYLSGNSTWRFCAVSDEEWILKVSDRGHLALVVKVAPGTTDCSASFKFIGELPDDYREIMEIALRALRMKCRRKIETICRTVEDLPFLLKSITIDVTWMKNFVQDLVNIASLENVQFKKRKALFSVASYKNLILFDVHIPLNNLKTLSVDDIDIDVKFGKVDINYVRRIFSESGRDYNFFSRFVQELVRTFGR